jgi:hypothetical protein
MSSEITRDEALWQAVLDVQSKPDAGGGTLADVAARMAELGHPGGVSSAEVAEVLGQETGFRLMRVFDELVAAGKMRVEISPVTGWPVCVPVNEGDDPIALLKESLKEHGLALKEEPANR